MKTHFRVAHHLFQKKRGSWLAACGECTAVSLDLFLTSPNLIVGACRFMTEENVNSSDAR